MLTKLSAIFMVIVALLRSASQAIEGKRAMKALQFLVLILALSGNAMALPNQGNSTLTSVVRKRRLSPQFYCVRPTERERCEQGFLDQSNVRGTCPSLVYYNSEELEQMTPIEKDLFNIACYLFEGFAYLQNCDCCLLPSDSSRDNAVDCYEGHGITVTKPARGRCEAGGCCSPDPPLCDIESEMHMMALGYGTRADPDRNGCESSLDYFGANHGCTVHTDGKSNEVVVCDNIGAVTTDEEELEDLNFCHITFAGTNDINDVFIYLGQVFDPLDRREKSFGTGDNKVTFTGVGALMDISFQSDSDEGDGIVEIAFKEAEKKGCFTRKGAAISLFGHSLGGALADYLALMIGGRYPSAFIKIRTLNAPAVLAKPLSGKAARLPVWKRKTQYINGLVMPRGPIFKNAYLVFRPYGVYQDYDPVSQMLPGGFYARNRRTKMRFLCESLNVKGDRLRYFVAGKSGCASGRSDVLNKMPSFPHPGGLVRNDESNFDEIFGATIRLLDFLLRLYWIRLDTEAFNIIATIADVNFRENFWLILDLHMMRRSLHFANIITSHGTKCKKTYRSIKIKP